MLFYAKASKVTTNEKIIQAADNLEGIKTEQEFNAIKDYRLKYLKPYIKTWKQAEKIINVNYTKSNLIADLKDMSKTISLAGNNPTMSKKSIPDKDLQRAQDILSKSGNSKDKSIQLTTTMANLTTDKSKLQARGDAMIELGRKDLAKIFLDKLKENKSIFENWDKEDKKELEIQDFELRKLKNYLTLAFKSFSNLGIDPEIKYDLNKLIDKVNKEMDSIRKTIKSIK